jgi:hypothetical protein
MFTVTGVGAASIEEMESCEWALFRAPGGLAAASFKILFAKGNRQFHIFPRTGRGLIETRQEEHVS